MEANPKVARLFGSGMNVLIEHTRKPSKRHLFVKKFVPVFQRILADGGPLDGTLRYERGDWNFYGTPTPTSIPQKIYPIMHVRRQREGQLCLFSL